MLSEMQSTMFFLFNSAISIFVIIDPFSVVPVYMSFAEKQTPEAMRKIRNKATIVAFVMLVSFAILGMAIFKFFSISMPAFQIAGGILLFIFGFEQLRVTISRVKPEEQQESLLKEDVSVFPLATPLLAGPGAISTVIMQSSLAYNMQTNSLKIMNLSALLLAIAGCLFATLLILRAGPLMLKHIGQTGMNLLSRIMGLLLTAIAIQYIINGIIAAIAK